MQLEQRLKDKYEDHQETTAIQEQSSAFISENLETSQRNFKTSNDRDLESPIDVANVSPEANVSPDTDAKGTSKETKNLSSFVVSNPLPLGEAEE